MTACAWAQIDTRVASSPAPSAAQAQGQQQQSQFDPYSPASGVLSGFESRLKEGLVANVNLVERLQNQGAASSRGGSPWTEGTNASGNLAFSRDWSRASLGLQYGVGSDFGNGDSQTNNYFQQISATENTRFSRWNLSLHEGATHLPQTSFGFGPSHFTGNGVHEIGEGPIPSSNVLLNHVSATEYYGNAGLEYLLDRSSSFSCSGTYGQTNLSSAGLLDSFYETGGAAYNRVLGQRDFAAISYSWEQFGSSGIAGRIRTQSIHLSYGRRIGNRLHVSLSAGPQFQKRSTDPAGFAAGPSVSASAGLDYSLKKFALNASYFHGITPGSGVFQGSQSDDVRGSVSRVFGRHWNTSLSAGYSHNQNLSFVGVSTQYINSGYFSATLVRDFGRTTSAFVSYSLQKQNSLLPICPSSACSSSLPNVLMFGLSFHIRPLLLRP